MPFWKQWFSRKKEELSDESDRSPRETLEKTEETSTTPIKEERETLKGIDQKTPPFIPAEETEELRKKILKALTQVVDPEIGLNVVDLGLIYNLEITPTYIHIQMGLTTPLCPYGPELLKMTELVVKEVTGYDAVTVEYQMDPPWTPERMSPEARSLYGLE